MENGKRLIDANELLAEVAKAQALEPDKAVAKIIMLITEAESMDTAEVVRCKDCIHWYEPDGVCLKIYSDGAVSPYAWQDRNPDDFCSHGERKSDG